MGDLFDEIRGFGCRDLRMCSFARPVSLPSLRVSIIVERSVARSHEAKGGRVGVKARDLAPKYCAETKVNEYCEKLKSKGLWSWDEDWPGDEEDCDWEKQFLQPKKK